MTSEESAAVATETCATGVSATLVSATNAPNVPKSRTKETTKKWDFGAIRRALKQFCAWWERGGKKAAGKRVNKDEKR